VRLHPAYQMRLRRSLEVDAVMPVGFVVHPGERAPGHPLGDVRRPRRRRPTDSPPGLLILDDVLLGSPVAPAWAGTS